MSQRRVFYCVILEENVDTIIENIVYSEVDWYCLPIKCFKYCLKYIFNVLPQLLSIVKCTLLYVRRTAGTPPVCVLDAVVILNELYI